MARDPKTTRGFRNRNPGNIDYNPANRWQGQVGIEATGNPPRFAVFETHEFGIRALAALLTTYFDRHGLNTVRKIINRWAPPNENSTSEYVLAVSRFMKNQPDDVLDLHTYAHMRPLVEAIIKHELGGVPYTDAEIDRGLTLAGLAKPITTVAEAAGTGTGRGVIAGTLGAGAVGVVVQAAPALTALQGLDWRVGVAIVVAGAIGVAVWLLSRRKDA